jgi:hypothetical protein
MLIQINQTYESASTAMLFEIVQGTTACSPPVFYGLLAWANLHAHKHTKQETTRLR